MPVLLIFFFELLSVGFLQVGTQWIHFAKFVLLAADKVAFVILFISVFFGLGDDLLGDCWRKEYDGFTGGQHEIPRHDRGCAHA